MNRALGVSFIAISAASFGTLAIFGRYAYANGLDTFTLLFLRFTFSALLMAGLLFIRRESLPRGGTLVRLAGMGALGLATLGAALTANPQGGQWSGILLALSAAGIYSVYIIIGTGVMRQVSALQSSVVIFAAAGIVSGVLTAINGPHWPVTSAGWLSVAAMTLLATVIPVVAFLAGLKLIGPTDASMLSTLEPVATVLLAALLFGEILQPVTLLGGGLILAAVLLLTRSELRQGRAADPPVN